MPVSAATWSRLCAIPSALILKDVALAGYTRFGIGGRAAVLFDTSDEEAFVAALKVMAETEDPHVVIGGGTNLVVSDDGYDGVTLRFTGSRIQRRELSIEAQAGAVLQSVVDFSISQGLKGLETLTGIPGYLGGAVYGNAGAYGRSIHQMAEKIRFFNGQDIQEFDNVQCRFLYRDSIFKSRKEWLILSAELRMAEGDALELARTADEIRAIRDAKYPPSMRCAGSIFKNLLFAELPAPVQSLIPTKVVREGKVPSAWFLEQTGVKGLRRGDIQVATYHANLIYNDGNGTAADLVWVIDELKKRVLGRFGFGIEEEVQYIGFKC